MNTMARHLRNSWHREGDTIAGHDGQRTWLITTDGKGRAVLTNSDGYRKSFKTAELAMSAAEKSVRLIKESAP